MPLVEKLKRFFEKSGKTNAVVGISGGIDSALTVWLCAQALGPKNVYAYFLPYVDHPDDTKQTNAFAQSLGVHYQAASIRAAADAVMNASQAIDPVDKGNIMARTRMNFLYSKARQHNALVVGTGNKSELSVGYFTKFGDGGVDVLPIGSLYKTQVWQMAKNAGIPKYFIDKPPSAGLWPDQTDEHELEMTYQELDAILQLLDTKPNEALQKFGEEKVKKVLDRMEQNRHKLDLPSVL
ncbi:NAD+ synthase [Candidatus Micrarchaeota archaeon]|nr:NAD+ synthase [Candidatus Micrarchaeota archaeon]